MFRNIMFRKLLQVSNYNDDKTGLDETRLDDSTDTTAISKSSNNHLNSNLNTNSSKTIQQQLTTTAQHMTSSTSANFLNFQNAINSASAKTKSNSYLSFVFVFNLLTRKI